MQIGTRWRVGAEAPARLPDAVKDAVAGLEAELAERNTERWWWTLTWLENRPVVDLDPAPGAEAPGATIRMGFDGSVTVTRDEV